MDIKRSLQSTTEPLEELIKHGESLDFRLDQRSWKDLDIGDFIEYWEDFTGWQKEPTKDARRVTAKIMHIYKAPTFKELFDIIEGEFCRLNDKQKLSKNLRKWWSEDKEQEKGVLAFHVKKINKDKL